jgi:tetratricopeptide (TPR) repeat protein
MLADALMLAGSARAEFLALADATDSGPQADAPTVAEMAADFYSARPSGGVPPQVVPRQLPAGVSHFVGRAKEMAVLARLTSPADRVVLISGAAGVGKTTLAVRWAQHTAERFPDGQLYVNLRGFGPSGTPITPSAAICGFFAALGVAASQIPAALEEQTALFRSLLATRRVLVLLDNARDAEQVRPLLPGTGACQTIVTSRDPLLSLIAVEGAYPLTPDLLTRHEAGELLAWRLGRQDVAQEKQAISALIEACAGLPLALSIAAARAAAHPEFSIASLVTELRNAGDRLGVLDAWDPASSVRAVFSWSYLHLTEQAARMFRFLSVHPGPDITVLAAASLAGIPQAQARQLLGDLTRTQLLAEHVPGRFAFHDLMRAYAGELLHELDDEAEREAAAGRILDHYLHSAQAADLRLYPAREPITLTAPRPGVAPENPVDRPQASAWYQAESQVLLALIAQAARAGRDAYVWQLPRAMETYLVWQGRWHELTAIQRGALGAAQRLDDLAAQAYSCRGLGRVSALLGLHDEACRYLAEALSLFRRLGDGLGEARTHIDLGTAYQRAECFREALSHATQALELYRRAGHRAGQAGSLNNAGWYQLGLGDYAQAVVYGAEALAIFREVGDRYGTAHSLDSLGSAHCRLGDYTRSIACYQESLALFRDAGNLIDQAEVLSRLAECQQAVGELPAARESWEQALALLDEMRHPGAAKTAPGSGRTLRFTTVTPVVDAAPRLVVSAPEVNQ